jgi:hypothetical protein
MEPPATDKSGVQKSMHQPPIVGAYARRPIAVNMKSALKPLEAKIMHRFENGASNFYVSVLSAG